MTKTIKTTLVTLAASVALFLTVLLCTGFTTAGAASADEICNHSYEQTEVAATCTTAGYTLYSCADCGNTYTEQTEAAKGHTYEIVIVPNTCTHKGYTTHFCTTCGYEYSDNYKDEMGHDYEEKEVEPTCTERGYTEHTCTICNDVFTGYLISYAQNSPRSLFRVCRQDREWGI